MVKLVIAGAMYRVGGRIVSPHYSGEFSMVDVDEFCIYQELLDSGFEPEEIEELLSDLSEVSVNGIEQLY